MKSSDPPRPPDTPASPHPDDLIPTRHSLLSRLRDWDDQESWNQFFQTYWKLIYRVALRAGLQDPEAQDVVQETIVSVAKKMPGFHYNPTLGSFKSWLLLITRRRIVDHLRKRGRQPATPLPQAHSRAHSDTDPIQSLPDPEPRNLDSVWDEEWEKQLLDLALRQLQDKVSPKQFQIFDCHVLQGWPVSDVVKHLKVSSAQVYLAKHRVAALLKKEIQSLRRHIEAHDAGPSHTPLPRA